MILWTIELSTDINGLLTLVIRLYNYHSARYNFKFTNYLRSIHYVMFLTHNAPSVGNHEYFTTTCVDK
jgi:succinylglutamate desuccinylase